MVKIKTIDKKQILRFLVTGILNTALSYGVYLVFLLVMNPYCSYATSYIVGIYSSFLMQRSWVYRSSRHMRSLLPFSVAQGLILTTGTLISATTTPFMPSWLVGLSTTILVLPLSYLVNSRILGRNDLTN